MAFLSTSMARGLSLTAGLTAIIAFVLVHPTCSAPDKVNQHCAPSFCGNIHNISFPFRLKTDPQNCGDSRYELSCENNRTVLQLLGGKYNVQEDINYNNYTIRVVDSGIHKDKFFSTPSYSFNRYNFRPQVSYPPTYTSYQWKKTKSEWFPELSRSLVLMSCEKPVNSSLYLDTATCSNDNSSNYVSHSSKRYRYIKVGVTNAIDVEDSCQVEKMFRTSWPRNDDPNISCTDIHNELVYGFEISWLSGICESFCEIGTYCYLNDANSVQCAYNGFWDRLYSLYIQYDIYKVVSNGLYILVIFFAAKVLFGTPCVVAFLIYKWRRRHLSMYDAVEDFLQSQNNLMPISRGNEIVMEDAMEEEKKIVKKMILVGLWCIQMKPSDRPSMNKVVEMLEGEVECLQMPSKPFLSSLGDVEDNLNPTCSSIQSGESSQSDQF
ncbi:hypothetical protein CMV_002740 [Castanea mollissima]|uniref:Wall-associated receptor kinase galacturonan-binding domain-containing protein n=1 Tax=Castanea mollissima TaxID=60419 RepID=A0A8J4W3G6_9ROSI|nr:hypothetical protein CMV_002740 [Castanea mollissima]